MGRAAHTHTHTLPTAAHTQVDALQMEAFVDSFIGALGLEKSYSLLVLNPKWSPSLPSYNYRIGFSEAEVRLLNAQVRRTERCMHVCIVCVQQPQQRQHQ